MIKKAALLLFLAISIIAKAQNKVCTNSGNDLNDLNTIGKCAIENFKSSNTKEFIQVSSRSRYVRKKRNTHLAKLKEHLKTVPEKRVTNNVAAPVVVKESETKITTSNVSSSSKVATSINAKGETVIKDYLRFDFVSSPPIFITCNSNNSYEEKQECNKETIVGVLLDNLVYPFDAAAEGIEGQVWVRFVIDKEGYVGNVTATGPENGELLEKEAERLVKLLPKFLPGKHNNDYVNVEYFMPIDFHLD